MPFPPAATWTLDVPPIDPATGMVIRVLEKGAWTWDDAGNGRAWYRFVTDENPRENIEMTCLENPVPTKYGAVAYWEFRETKSVKKTESETGRIRTWAFQSKAVKQEKEDGTVVMAIGIYTFLSAITHTLQFVGFAVKS